RHLGDDDRVALGRQDEELRAGERVVQPDGGAGAGEVLEVLLPADQQRVQLARGHQRPRLRVAPLHLRPTEQRVRRVPGPHDPTSTGTSRAARCVARGAPPPASARDCTGRAGAGRGRSVSNPAGSWYPSPSRRWRRDEPRCRRTRGVSDDAFTAAPGGWRRSLPMAGRTTVFELKLLSRESIPGALAKAERYRLLNQPWEAESIYLDVLQVDPDHQEALVGLLLALT